MRWQKEAPIFIRILKRFDKKAASKNLKVDVLPALKLAFSKFEALESDTWQATDLHSVIHQVAEELSIKLGKIAQPIRVAITSNTISPPIDVTLELIGKERVLARLQKAIDWIASD